METVWNFNHGSRLRTLDLAVWRSDPHYPVDLGWA